MDARTAPAPVLREVVALASVGVLPVVVDMAPGAQVSLVLDTPKLVRSRWAAHVKVHQEWDVAVHVVATP